MLSANGASQRSRRTTRPAASGARRGGVAQHGEGGEVELAAGRELDAGPDLGERAHRIVVRRERCGLGGTEHGDPQYPGDADRGTAATGSKRTPGSGAHDAGRRASRMNRRTAVVASKPDGLLLGSRPVSFVRGQPWSVPVSAYALDARAAVAAGVGEVGDEPLRRASTAAFAEQPSRCAHVAV